LTGDGRGGGEDPPVQSRGGREYQPGSGAQSGLRGRLDVGGIGLGVGAGLNRPAGRGQWERPAGRWAAGGRWFFAREPVGFGFHV
jgi:hypothetical protein